MWKCKVSTEKTDAVPGTIFLADKEGIHTACGEGVLILTEVQLEGKKRMEQKPFSGDITLKMELFLQIIRSD